MKGEESHGSGIVSRTNTKCIKKRAEITMFSRVDEVCCVVTELHDAIVTGVNHKMPQRSNLIKIIKVKATD